MAVLIDTSLIIAAERRGAPYDTVRAPDGEQVLLSVISVSELLYGVHRAVDPIVRVRRSALVEAVLARASFLPIEPEDARTHAALRAELDRRGTPIGPQDLWIAAQAVARGYAVATANVREFARVPGLRVLG